jgi:hypothetical protein
MAGPVSKRDKERHDAMDVANGVPVRVPQTPTQASPKLRKPCRAVPKMGQRLVFML